MPPVVGLVAHPDYRSVLVQELGRTGLSVAPLTFEADKIDGLLIDGSSLNGQLPKGTPDLGYHEIWYSSDSSNAMEMCYSGVADS